MTKSQIERGPKFDALVLIAATQEADENADCQALASLTHNVTAWEAAFYYVDPDMARLTAECAIARLCESSNPVWVQAGLSFARRLMVAPLGDEAFHRDLLTQYADDWVNGLLSPYDRYIALQAAARAVLGKRHFHKALPFLRARMDELRPAYRAGVERRADHQARHPSLSGQQKPATLRTDDGFFIK